MSRVSVVIVSVTALIYHFIGWFVVGFALSQLATANANLISIKYKLDRIERAIADAEPNP